MPRHQSAALRRALLIVGLPVLAGACAMTFDARSLGIPAAMSAPATEPAAGDTFRITQTSVHLFWGLYESRSVSLQNALAGQLAAGRGVADLRIRIHRRWSDILGTVLSAGLIVPSTVTFEGVITQARP